MNPAAPSRVRSVDCAKCLAIFCVLLIHAASDVLRGGPISSIRWLSGLFWGSVSRGAVPLFLLCSGALLLDAERTISARHIWRRNIPHMLLALFFWAAVYKAIGLLTAGQTGRRRAARRSARLAALAARGASLLPAGHPACLCRAPAHAHLHRTCRCENNALFSRLLGSRSASCCPHFGSSACCKTSVGSSGQWPLPMVWSAIGCTVLGDALRRRPLTARCAGLLFAAGFLLCFAGTWLLSAKAGELKTPFLEGFSPGPCLMAAGLFSLCTQPQRLHRPAERLSRASFCIYLVHIAVLRLLGALGLHANRFAMLSIPAVAVLCGAISYFIYLPLSKLPWIKRWLI